MNYRVVLADDEPEVLRSIQRTLDWEKYGFSVAVSYTHLRAHETDSYLVCRLLLEKKKNTDIVTLRINDFHLNTHKEH